MTLADQLAELAELASKLKAKGQDLSEANTKVSFIQPILESLGWRVTDPDEVLLEYPVYGGTRLDYALLVDAKPALYLEAKSLRASMSDASFIAQTVSYASNDGIRWCVLSNGLIWRIYKSDTLAPADKKLLAEVDIREASDAFGAARVASTLAYLSKESLTAGRLDEWGERVFLDTAVRRALDSVFAEGSAGLVSLVRKHLEEPYPPKKIKESLQRRSTGGEPHSPTEAAVPAGPEPPGSRSEAARKAWDSRRATFGLEHHTTGKPEAIVDLFGKLDARLMALGPDVERVFLKQYVNYKCKRSFATLRLDKGRLVMCVSMQFGEAPRPAGLGMRDLAGLGHQGLGNTEVTVGSDDDLAGAEAVARASYERVSYPRTRNAATILTLRPTPLRNKATEA